MSDQPSIRTYGWLHLAHKQADFNVIIKQTVIPCHKEVLCQASSFFRAMLDSKMLETQLLEVTLKEVNEEPFTDLLKYAYTGHLDLESDCEYLYTLTKMACMYQFDNAVQKCSVGLLERTNAETCLAIAAVADLYTLDKVYCLAMKTALWEFEKVRLVESFIHTPQELLKVYLSHDGLNCCSEYSVFEAVTRWMQNTCMKGDDNTVFDSQDLLEVIRLKDLKQEEIVRVLSKDSFIKRFPDFERVLQNQLDQCLTSSLYKDGCGKQFSSRCVPYRFYVVLAEDEITPNLVTVGFNPHHFSWSTGIELPLRFPSNAKMCLNGHYLYVSGGEAMIGRGNWMLDVWRYDTFTGIWRTVTKLPSPRRNHGFYSVNNKLYLIGGFSRYRMKTNTVDMYDCETGIWTKLSPIPGTVSNPAVCVYNNTLFVLKHDVIQCYDINSETWTNLPLNPVNTAIDMHISHVLCLPESCRLIFKCEYSTALYQYNIVSTHIVKLGDYEYEAGHMMYFDQKLFLLQSVKKNGTVEYYDLMCNSFVKVPVSIDKDLDGLVDLDIDLSKLLILSALHYEFK